MTRSHVDRLLYLVLVQTRPPAHMVRTSTMFLIRMHRLISDLKAGCKAPVARSPASTFRSTSTSTPSASNLDAPRRSHARHLFGLQRQQQPTTYRSIVAASSGVKNPAELTGYA